MAAQKQPHYVLALKRNVEIVDDFESGFIMKTVLVMYAFAKSSLLITRHAKKERK